MKGEIEAMLIWDSGWVDIANVSVSEDGGVGQKINMKQETEINCVIKERIGLQSRALADTDASEELERYVQKTATS